MQTPNLPSPSPEKLREAHRLADDAGAVAAAFPPADVWKAEFPDCYTEAPDGKFNVAYRNQRNTAEQNERNSKKVQALVAEWAAKSLETSSRRDAAIDTVRVRGRDGTVMHLPAQIERKLAARGAVKPVRHWGRGTTYWTDRHGNRWKRKHRGEWEPDNG